MTVEVIAWSFADGMALILNDGVLQEVQPPYREGPTPAPDQARQDAFRHWGYTTPDEWDSSFNSLEDLYARLREGLASTVARYQELTKEKIDLRKTPIAQLDRGGLERKLKDIDLFYIKAKNYSGAIEYLLAFLELDNVRKNLAIKVKAEKMKDMVLKNIAPIRRELFKGPQYLTSQRVAA